MQKLIFIFLIIAGFMTITSAQTLPEFPRNEIFVGYSFHSPTFFGSGRQDNFRVSVGVVFRR